MSESLAPPIRSEEYERYTSGFSRSGLYGQDLTVSGSAPGWSDSGAAKHNDSYRNALNDTREGLDNTPFKQGYRGYKRQEKLANKAEEEANNFLKTSNTEEARQAAQLSPGGYGGNLFESGEWHGKAAAQRQASADQFGEAVEARDQYQKTYIGYDSKCGYLGRKERVVGLGNITARETRKVTSHLRASRRTGQQNGAGNH